MDIARFDRLVIAFGAAASRRGLLAGLTSGAFATLPLVLSGGDAAAKRRRKKKKRCKGGKKKCGKKCIPKANCCKDADCDDGESCQNGSCTSNCTPQCDGRTCGADGCGGSCGACGRNEVCDGGTCVCVPACAPAEACGSDGCGGSCGSCDPRRTCTGNQISSYSCDNGVCMPVTTNCPAGQVCFEGDCCTKSTPPTCRKQPVSDGCGGTFPANCGPNQFCCEGPNGDLICQATPCP